VKHLPQLALLQKNIDLDMQDVNHGELRSIKSIIPHLGGFTPMNREGRGMHEVQVKANA